MFDWILNTLLSWYESEVVLAPLSQAFSMTTFNLKSHHHVKVVLNDGTLYWLWQKYRDRNWFFFKKIKFLFFKFVFWLSFEFYFNLVLYFTSRVMHFNTFLIRFQCLFSLNENKFLRKDGTIPGRAVHSNRCNHPEFL